MTYRDLGAEPVPHFDTASGLARMVPADVHTPEQAASWALSVALIDEVKAADTIILGLPLYNFGPPSTVKAWVDHLIAPGLSLDAETRAPPAHRPRPDRPRLPRRRLRRRHAARGLGPRRAVAAARPVADRPGAALHHRRAAARAGHARDEGPDPDGRGVAGRRAARRRRPLGRRRDARLDDRTSRSPDRGMGAGRRATDQAVMRRLAPRLLRTKMVLQILSVAVIALATITIVLGPALVVGPAQGDRGAGRAAGGRARQRGRRRLRRAPAARAHHRDVHGRPDQPEPGRGQRAAQAPADRQPDGRRDLRRLRRQRVRRATTRPTRAPGTARPTGPGASSRTGTA